MSSQATIGYGTLFQRGNGNGPPETFTSVTESAEIDAPQSVADDVEVTHLTSPGRRKEFIQGMIDSGEASVRFNWIPDDPMQDHLTGLMADKNLGTRKNWRIVFPDGLLTWTFFGFVQSFEPDTITANDPLRATCKIRVSSETLA